MLVSESQEFSIGKQNYSPLRQSQGGDYVADPQLQAYFNESGVTGWLVWTKDASHW